MGTARVVFDRWDGRYAERMGSVRSSAVRDLFAAASRPDIISLSGGMPAVDHVPAEAAATAAYEAVLHERECALQYGSSDGRPEIRAVITELMAENGVRLGIDDIIVTAGAQQGLDLLAKTFLNPGDVIITEGPTYVGALQAFSAYQPDIRCIPMDDEGMRIDELERELKSLGHQGAKFIYTIPNFQNPAGVTLSAERRRRLLELAREYDVLVVEDDPYGRLRFDGGHIKPLRALDDEVIYLGTFSKIFAPGLRLGWMVAPHPIRAKVLLAKQAADLCGSAFAQVTAERYFTGFFVWVELPSFLDAGQLLAEAVEHGVTFVPGDGFYPDGRSGRNCMRLAFCYAEPEKITEGIRRLAEVIEDRLELYRAFIDAGAIPAPTEDVA